MYHSCSPLEASVPPFPLGSAYQKVVSQVPPGLDGLHKLRLLNSSSKVTWAVPARLFGSIAMARRGPFTAPRRQRRSWITGAVRSSGGWFAWDPQYENLSPKQRRQPDAVDMHTCGDCARISLRQSLF